jgi:zinc protease
VKLREGLSIGLRQLANGMSLIGIENAGSGTFAAGIMLDVDMRDEPPAETGLAHLVGDCLDEGTRKRNGVRLAEAVEALGAVLEGSASGGSIAGPAEVAPRALDLLVETVTQPSFPPREVARVKNEVATEIQADLDDPRTVASQRFRKEVFGEHPSGRPPRGTLPALAKLTPARLRSFHAKWFRAGRGYFAAAGPAPVEQTLDQLEKLARRFAPGVNAHATLTPPSLPPERRDLHLPMRREQVHVFVGHPGIRRVDPDYYALLVMDHVLGTGPGFTSRIARKLRDEMGLCYSVNASITSTAGEEPGCFAAYIGTSPEHRQKAIDGFVREIEKIRAEPPTAQELRDVQEYLIGSVVFTYERNSNLVRYAVRCLRFDLGLDFMLRYPELIRSVTTEDVLRVARTHLHPERVVIVSAGA